MTARKKRLTAAEKTRRWRARRAQGRCVVPVEVGERDADALVAGGLLPPAATDNRGALRDAIARLLAAYTARVTGHDIA